MNYYLHIGTCRTLQYYVYIIINLKLFSFHMTFSKYSKFSHNGFVPHRPISNYMILNDIHDVLIQVHKSFSFWIILTSNERRSELIYTLKFLCVYSNVFSLLIYFKKRNLVKNCKHHATLQ